MHSMTDQTDALAFSELVQWNVVLANRLRPEAPVTIVHMFTLMTFFPVQSGRFFEATYSIDHIKPLHLK